MPNHSNVNPPPPPPPPGDQGDNILPNFKPYARMDFDSTGAQSHRNEGGVFVRYGSPVVGESRTFPMDFSIGDAINAQENQQTPNQQTPNPKFTATQKAGISPLLILVVLGIILTSK